MRQCNDTNLADAAPAADIPPVRPTLEEFGLTEELLAREIARDTAHARCFGNGHITPGSGVALLAMALTVAASNVAPSAVAVPLLCCALPVAFLTGKLGNRIVKWSMRHSDAYLAHRRAWAQYRLHCDQYEAASAPLFNRNHHQARPNGIFRANDSGKSDSKADGPSLAA